MTSSRICKVVPAKRPFTCQARHMLTRGFRVFIKIKITKRLSNISLHNKEAKVNFRDFKRNQR